MKKEILYQHNKIVYRLFGKGNPVVLLHGFGEDGTIWNDQIDFLKNNFQLIVPDLPGSGQSEIIEDMSMEGMAEVIKKILDTESADSSPNGGGGVGAVGHSMGGYITLAFAEKYPELLKTFCLFHSSAFADNEEKKAVRKKGIEFINKHGAFEFLKTIIPGFFAPQTRELKPELVTKQIEPAGNFSNASLLNYYEAMMQRPDRTEVLKNSKVPVLFIAGEFDNAVPLNDVLKQCHLPELSYFHILKNSGHLGMIEEPGISNKLLKKFLMDLRY